MEDKPSDFEWEFDLDHSDEERIQQLSQLVNKLSNRVFIEMCI